MSVSVSTETEVCEPEPKPHPRLWACEKCQYLLGHIREDSSHVDRLDVFRRAVPSALLVRLDADDLFSVEELDSGTVRCSHCGHRQKWHISERALARLLSRRKARKFGLEAYD